MSLARHATRRIAHTHLSSCSSRLSIGDDYLNALLHQFTISEPCVRHGSSVPGPLEARKRQAKRKMMNLAPVEGGGSIDNGALMGMGKSFSEKELKWELPRQLPQHPEPQSSRLPSWIQDFNASASEDAPLRLSQSDSKSTDAGSRAFADNVELEKLSLESELQTSSTIEKIRMAVFHHNPTMGLNQAHSALGFMRLVDSDSSMSILLEYLEDKKLNNPAARNLAVLTAWRGPERAHDEIGLLESWIERRIAHGILSEHEIQHLIHGLSGALRQWNMPRRPRSHAWSLYKSIWAGIQASDSNGISKIGLDTVRPLLDVASRSPDRGEGRRIGMNILKMRQNLADLLPNISHFAVQLSEIPSSRLPDGTIGPEVEWAFSWFYPLLAQVPEKNASAIIANLSGKLTRRFLNGERSSDVWAQEWFGVLPPKVFQAARMDSKWTEKWWHIDQSLASSNRPGSVKTLASYLLLFEARERYLFLLRYWVPPRWPRGDKIKVFVFSEASADTASWKEFIRKVELEEYFPGIDRDTMLLEIVRKLHMTYYLVLRTILPDLLHLLRHIGQSSAILRIARYLKEQNISLDYTVWAAELNAHVKTNLPLAYELFTLETRLRLENCPGFAEAIITDPSFEAVDIFELLKRQPRTIGSVPQTTHPERLLSITSERVSLLHKMALAFADAPHLNPRQAYRKVTRLAQFFRDRPDLLRPEMSKALTTAGVVRYLEAGMWVSTVRFNYIIGMVRGLEGEAVAQELDRVVFEWREQNIETAKGSMERAVKRKMMAGTKGGNSEETDVLTVGDEENARGADLGDGDEAPEHGNPDSAGGRGVLVWKSGR
ncbi:hypothetical protein MMC30_005688 [Trapelia coarctata]|nr:hypothetical protein [Trapelia coarctata]